MPENREHVNLTEADIRRFWRTVDQLEEGCWNWKNKPGKFKYCYFWKVIGTRKNKGYFAHRIAFFLDRGYLPKNLEICHSCDNCRCVRPDHLFSGTRLDNAQDMVRKGRSLAGSKNYAHQHPECMERGTDRYNAKLDEEIVREIRRLYAAGGISFVRLGAQFGIGGPTAFKIVRRKMWTHII